MKQFVRMIPALMGAALVLNACGATSPTTTETARDLVLTSAVRQSLLHAAASYHRLPASDYVGLRSGATYYAFDPATDTYYAAAGLRPSPTSLEAQVGAQDDGAYNLFARVATSSTWTVYDDGLGGVQGTRCPITIPSAVLAVWNWKAKSCYPPPAR